MATARSQSIFTRPNDMLLRPEQLRSHTGQAHSRDSWRLYEYLPRLVFAARTEELTRLPADYVHAASRFAERNGSGFHIPVLRSFAETEYADHLTRAAKDDVDNRLTRASREGRITSRDVAFIFNLGRMTVSNWCTLEIGLFDQTFEGQQAYISEESIRSSYAWRVPGSGPDAMDAPDAPVGAR